MAAFTRPTIANAVFHESASFDTSDFEDHSFCGIMFPVSCATSLPVSSIGISSFAVRGDLGSMTVHVTEPVPTTPSARTKIQPDSTLFKKVYDAHHDPSTSRGTTSRGKYTALVFDDPLVIPAGFTVHVYIHSTLRGDSALIYDNYAGK